MGANPKPQTLNPKPWLCGVCRASSCELEPGGFTGFRVYRVSRFRGLGVQGLGLAGLGLGVYALGVQVLGFKGLGV